MLDHIAQHRQQLAELCRKYDVARLDVFGSAVRADFDPAHSDLDFLVHFNDFAIYNAADRSFDFLSDLEKLFDRKNDLVSDTAIRNPYFRKSVDQERVNLYAASWPPGPDSSQINPPPDRMGTQERVAWLEVEEGRRPAK